MWRLNEANVASMSLGSGVIAVHGTAFDCTPRSNESEDDVFDRLVKAALIELLASVAATQIDQRGGDLTVATTDLGVLVRAPNGTAAAVQGSCALVGPERRLIRGNFLRPGVHWSQVLAMLRERGVPQGAPASWCHPSPAWR